MRIVDQRQELTLNGSVLIDYTTIKSMQFRLRSIFALILLLNSVDSGGQTLWGMLPRGGATGNGTIFKINADGTNFEAKHHFTSLNPGGAPHNSKLVEVNEKLYGVTRDGGTYDMGVLFEYDFVNNTYSVKVQFKNSLDGKPNCGLILASNGKLYGRTMGRIFEYNVATGSFAFVATLTPEMMGGGGLIEGDPGKLYGLGNGGMFGYGCIFEFDITTNTVSQRKFWDVSDNINIGAAPKGDFLKAPNGKLYGYTSKGGASEYGTIIEFDPSTNTLSKMLDFSSYSLGGGSKAPGAWPYGAPILGNDGKLYGVTSSGGSWAFGALFEYDYVNNVATRRGDFLPYGAARCVGSLCLASDGKMYGTTQRQFGDEWNGTLFKFDPATNKVNTITTLSGTSSSTPIQASNGKLYFLVSNGGLGMRGRLCEYELGGFDIVTKVDFDVPVDGSRPEGKLTQAHNGKFYGITTAGGVGAGVIFEFDPATGGYQKKVDVSNLTENYHGVTSNFAVHPNGKLYGVLQGHYGAGGIVEFNPASGVVDRSLPLVTGFGDGGGDTPLGGLVLTPSGKMYGTMSAGGPSNGGAIYEFDPIAFKVTKLATMSTQTGLNPSGELLFHNGRLYGSARTGGIDNAGTVFSFDPPTNLIEKVVDFGGTLGIRPNGTLIAGPNGHLYGTTRYGGYEFSGVVFEVDEQAKAFVTNMSFSSPSTVGLVPQAGLTLLPNGTMAGLTFSDGVNQAGVYYTYNPVTYEIESRHVFDHVNGDFPTVNTLVFAKQSQTLSVSTSPISKTYGDADFTIPATASSGLTVSYYSSNTAVVEVIDGSLRIKSAGTSTIYVSQIGNNQYLPSAQQKISVTVGKAALTATANNAAKNYGEANPAFTIDYIGFKAGDGTSVIDVLPAVTTTALTMSNVGSYPIQLSGGSDNNYTITLVNGTLNISKATLETKANNLSTVYGSSIPFLTISYSGFKGSDSPSELDLEPTITTAATASSDAGSYPIELSGGYDNNYAYHFQNGILTIDKAVLTVSVDNKTSIYGSVIPILTFSYSGFRNGDLKTDLNQEPSISTLATQTSHAGTYPINLSGGNDTNYSFSLQSGTLTITKA
ncbi:MAG: choice-of-anchor tandem repeat GloVer-containing protein, partial [Bacteroidota bacterium]